MWNIIQIQNDIKEVLSGYWAWVCVQFDHGIEDMTLNESHDTSLDHGTQMCEIICKSNMSVRRYSPDIDFGYVCIIVKKVILIRQGSKKF